MVIFQIQKNYSDRSISIPVYPGLKRIQIEKFIVNLKRVLSEI